MTIEEFYDNLRLTKKYINWSLECGNMITGRLKTDKEKMFCPLTAVHYYQTGQYIPLSQFNEVDVDNPNKIADSADGFGNRKIRDNLMLTLGIKE